MTLDRDPAHTASDGTCIAASLADPQAFEAVFRRHHATVHAYLARRSDRTVADDLAGEVFCRAFRARDRFDDRGPDAVPWLIGFARNVLHERRRADGREARHLGRAAVDPTVAHIRTVAEAGEVQEQHADRSGDLAAARTALAQLPEALVEPLLLFAWERLTYDQIAETLAIPIGTVRSRIARSRARLAELLAVSGQEEDEASPERKALT